MPLLILVALAAGGGATWLVMTQRSSAEPAEKPHEPAGQQEPSAPPPVAKATVPPPDTPEDDDAGMLLLPDGSEVKPLNGAKNPPKMLWQNPQWSPIVGTEHSSGLDWYVHADGTYSTTIMLWRSDLGRTDATTQVLHPRDPKPTRPLPGSAQPPGNQKK